jgi:glyceraldehyde 3-phosphate dehydrogenase
VIPALSGKLKGHAQRVPVKTGSTELVAILGKKVTVEEINAALKKAQGNKSFGYTDEEIVSSDVIGSHYGSVFDATQTEVSEAGDLQLVKAVAWYDNEYGFVTQLVRTLDKFAALCFPLTLSPMGRGDCSVPKLFYVRPSGQDPAVAVSTPMTASGNST